jgi:hypothetical protein
MRRKSQKKKTKRPKLRLGLPDLDQSNQPFSEVYARPSRDADIDMPSTSSLNGTARSRDCP